MARNRNNNPPPFATQEPALDSDPEREPAPKPSKMIVQLSRTHQRIRGGIKFPRGRTEIELADLSEAQVREIAGDEVLKHRFE